MCSSVFTHWAELSRIQGVFLGIRVAHANTVAFVRPPCNVQIVHILLKEQLGILRWRNSACLYEEHLPQLCPAA